MFHLDFESQTFGPHYKLYKNNTKELISNKINSSQTFQALLIKSEHSSANCY